MSVPAEAEWYQHPQFDSDSANYFCYVTGRDAEKGEGIIRGPYIDHEGYFDITIFAAEQLAKMIGWVRPDEVNKMKATVKEDSKALQALEADREDMDELNTVLTKQNAALMFELESAEKELARLKGAFDD